MHRVVNVAALVAATLLLPSGVFAQATIAGVVRDASAAVLPGVTVEASSPVLIEKTRTVVSDGTGQYRMTDLLPGTYVLTFSLPGFTTVKRDGVVVSGSGVTAINVELRVGALEETITSLEDARRRHAVGRREVVLNSETLNTLPARAVTVGAGGGAALNIGGVAGAGATTAPTTPSMTFFTAHGGASGEGRVMTNGLTVAAPFGGGGVSDVTYDIANAEEMQVLISGGLGEAETGGPSINIVPKSGGNQFRARVLQHLGDWATRTTSTRSCKASGSRSRPRCARIGMRAQHRRSDHARPALVLWHYATGQRRGCQRHLGEPATRATRRAGTTWRSVDRSHARRRRADLAAAYGPAHASNRVTF